MLKIKNLTVKIKKNTTIHNLNLKIQDGEIAFLFGANGSGKTTLFKTIAGLSKYKVTSGSIIFNETDITNMPIDKRAKLGLGIMFQNPPKIAGIKLRHILRKNSNEKKNCKHLNVEQFMNRDINVGLSGGEIKRSEIFQLLENTNLSFYLLDEPDSGIDVVNLKLIAKTINQMVNRKNKSALIVTHSGSMLDYINANRAFVMVNGKIKCTQKPRQIYQMIEKEGYKKCFQCNGTPK